MAGDGIARYPSVQLRARQCGVPITGGHCEKMLARARRVKTHEHAVKPPNVETAH